MALYGSSIRLDSQVCDVVLLQVPCCLAHRVICKVDQPFFICSYSIIHCCFTVVFPPLLYYPLSLPVTTQFAEYELVQLQRWVDVVED